MSENTAVKESKMSGQDNQPQFKERRKTWGLNYMYFNARGITGKTDKCRRGLAQETGISQL